MFFQAAGAAGVAVPDIYEIFRRLVDGLPVVSQYAHLEIAPAFAADADASAGQVGAAEVEPAAIEQNHLEMDARAAAHLEKILNKRVLNAGVGAYGIDQAFLRAELLLDKYDPDVVILSFISDDINRTEYSYYPYGRGWKPYFEYGDGSLILRNVPVPQEPSPRGSRSFQTFRRALRYSFLANAVLDRVARQWWQDLPAIEQIHHDGENVSVDLLVRLDGLTKDRRGQFISIAFATNGRIGDNARLPNLVKRLREKGVEVLDLSTEMFKLQPSQLQNLFLPCGHYSPAMNSSVAEHIAAFLHERGIRSPSEQSRTVP